LATQLDGAHPDGYPHQVEDPVDPPSLGAKFVRDPNPDRQRAKYGTDPQDRGNQIDHLDRGHADERARSRSHPGHG
jgi:hypothetical protein